MLNPKNDTYYLAINSPSGKASIDPSILIVYEVQNNVVDINDAPVAKPEKSVIFGESLEKLIGFHKQVKKCKVKGKEVEPIIKTIP